MVTTGGMVMCAYHIAVNLPQTFKGTLTIPLVSNWRFIFIFMETNLEHEKEIRSIKNDVTFYEIGEKGSLIPMVIEDEKQCKITEVLFCESISGGSDEIDNMPKSLTLTKLKMIDGKLHSFMAEYQIYTHKD